MMSTATLRIRLKDHWAEQQLFTRRVLISAVLVALLTGVVIARLAQLQVVEFEYFSAQSQGNHIRIQPVPPTRGLIYDRNGAVLAENLPSYQLEIIAEQVPDLDDTLARLVDEGLLAADELPALQQRIAAHRRFDAVPLRERLSDEEVARFAVLRPYFSGVDIRARLARNYPHGADLAHALGYVGGISADELQRLEASKYAGTSHIGKIAVEGSYENALHGITGHQEVLVNARGRVMQVLEHLPATPGRDLVLTLDLDTQLAAQRALGGRRGAVVAVDPDNGDVIALASTPTFDPNGISSGLTHSEYAALNNDPDRPLFNRALRGNYPPGSTVKPIIALAGLAGGAIDPARQVMCPGFYSLPGKSHRYRDWKRWGHGMVDLADAIAESCDVYFYDLATTLGIDPMAEMLKHFGLGRATGIDVAGEKNGLVPSRAWKRDAFSDPGHKVWFPGETVITGIGQGYLLATPLQLAHATAAIASRGQRYRPRLLLGTRAPGSQVLQPAAPAALEPVPIDDATAWDHIIAGMDEVMNGRKGTAREAGRDAPWRIAGKSGTAQVFSVAQDDEYEAEEIAERMRDHALFVAFGPVSNPRIAVAVIIENGESGSRVAAPVARTVIETWLAKNNVPRDREAAPQLADAGDAG